MIATGGVKRTVFAHRLHKRLAASRGTLVAFGGVVACIALIAKLFATVPEWFPCSVAAATEAWGAILLLEFAVGIILIIWNKSVAAWSLGVVFFSAVGAVAAWLALMSYSSCRCFGPLDTNPITMAMADAVVVGLLLMVCPVSFRDLPRHILWTVMGMLLAIGPISVVVWGVHRWRASASPFRIPGVVRLGSIPAKGETFFDVEVANDSDAPLVIHSASGPNTRFDEIPFRVPAKTVARLHGRFYSTGRPGAFCITTWYAVGHRGVLRYYASHLSGTMVGGDVQSNAVAR